MEKYQNSVTNSGGQSVAGARVTVTTLAGAAATIYSDNGVTPTANPLTTNAQGEFSFYAANGRYTLTTTGAGIRPDTTSDIILYDRADDPSPTSAALAAEGGAALVGFIQDGAGAAKRTSEDKLRDTVNAEDFFLAGEADATGKMQRAINAVFNAGGGEVEIGPGVYNVSQTAETLPVLLVSSGGGLNPTDTSTQACIVLRSGVTLVGAGVGVTEIVAPAIQRIAIAPYDMSSGGLRNMSISGGKGVFTLVSSLEADMCNLVLDNLEIYNSLSYGLGMQYGFYKNNRLSRLYIHDTAQDALDHKARARPSTGEHPYGNSIRSVLCERYGQTSATESAGIDIRGQCEVDDIVCRNFYVAGKNNRGIRFSTGVTIVNDKRVGSGKSSLTNFYIDSGNAADAGTIGFEILEAGHLAISNGVIENCYSGLKTSDAATGNGRGAFGRISNVEVFGSRGTAFQSHEENVTFVGCKAIAAEDYFTANLDNLVAGQTTLVVRRTFDPAIVKVYKNSALLALGVDYTITGTDTINLAVAALDTDEYLVQTPTGTGFSFTTANARSAINNSVVACSTKGAITPLTANAASSATLAQSGNNFEAAGVRSPSGAAGTLEAFGPAADYEMEIFAKGTGGVTLRSQGARSLRAENTVSNAVNWVTVRGSASGAAPRLAMAGSDANIDFLLLPKGTGNISFGTHTANADTPITGYITIKDAGGVVRKLAVIT